MTGVNALYKEYIEKMPENFTTKKEIDDYEKEFWKSQKELKVKAPRKPRAKKPKAVKAAETDDESEDKSDVDAKPAGKAPRKALANKAKKEKRPKAEPKVDDDGNVKVRVPTAYNLFVKEQRLIVKKAHPELSNKELFSEIAKLWRIKKGVPVVDATKGGETEESVASMAGEAAEAGEAYFEDSSSDEESDDESSDEE
jgi:hypothetical protein